MRKMKKIVSILLAATMLLTSVNAFAVDSGDGEIVEGGGASTSTGVSIDWEEDATVTALGYKLLEYAEGDTFSPGDAVFVNRGGSEGGSAFMATAIGSELRGLDYIRGRYTSGSDHSETRTFLGELAEAGTPMLSFTANLSGTIYVVFRSNYENTMASYLEAENPWTELDVTYESVEGSYTLPSSAVVDYSDRTLDNWIRSAENSDMDSNEEAPVNAFEPDNMPYSFAIFSEKTSNSGFGIQHMYTKSYKKDFVAGTEVDIPSPGSVNFIPMYFIKWNQ